MDEKTKNTLIKIGLKVLSVALTVVFVVSCLGATLISGVRHFFKGGQFETMVSEMKLEEVKFTANGVTYTANDFIYDAVTKILPNYLKGQLGLFNQIFGNAVNQAVEEIITSDSVNKAVKDTMMDCVDYYLESDAKQAKERQKENKTVINTAEDYSSVSTPEEAVKVYVRSFVIRTIENSSGLTSDQIIVLLSNNTKSKCIAVAVISAILLIVCNLSSVFDIILYFGLGSVASGIVIKTLQSKFENAQADKSLIGYQMLKPLIDSFTPNAIAGIVIGVILILAFVGIFLMYRSKATPTETVNVK